MKILAVVVSVSVAYIGSYAYLRGESSYPDYGQQDDLYRKMRDEHKSTLYYKWQPYLACFDEMRYVNGQTIYETNLLGYVFAPLIIMDQRHRSSMALSVTDVGF